MTKYENNGLVGGRDPQSARIRPKATRAEILMVMSELDAWLADKPPMVRHMAQRIFHGLNSALIGAKPSPMVVEMLAQDVADLERAVRG